MCSVGRASVAATKRCIMYKVVIIDDEPIIVEGLSRSIPWEKWDCKVVATANSGEEGLEVISRERPDILFSDISMPGMDGLTMIAALKLEYPDIEITILTGYRDFEYAREAIRLGVTRFLLKPSKMDEIKEAVGIMCDNLKEKENFNRMKEKEEETATEAGAMSAVVSEKSVHDAEKMLSAEETDHEFTGEMAPELIGNELGDVEESAAGSFIVNNALKYIEENYTQKLKLADVAEHVYVSQWHLSKLLNGYTGQSFSDILNNVRIDKAKELLHDPSLRIGDVADMVGFLDMAHFSRVFKKQAGISANEYRNRIS